ncbi:hypothetical protein PEDI_02950 [Persicobacter diffluens]|uniref:Uncharacterized protein n=1 Tax=Persicobacter diffluens TaxID=981 RepID=A0AAN5AKB9_9BACT|nr:hypothetical protein PEDI_02950 [Persicobacter diffluens]
MRLGLRKKSGCDIKTQIVGILFPISNIWRHSSRNILEYFRWKNFLRDVTLSIISGKLLEMSMGIAYLGVNCTK